MTAKMDSKISDLIELVNTNQEARATQNQANFVNSIFREPSIAETENFSAYSHRSFTSSVMPMFIPEFVTEESRLELKEKQLTDAINKGGSSPDNNSSKLFVSLPNSSKINPDPASYIHYDMELNSIKTSTNHSDKKTKQKNYLAKDLYKIVRAEYLAKVKQYRNKKVQPAWMMQDTLKKASDHKQRREASIVQTLKEKRNSVNIDTFEDDEINLTEFYAIYEERYKEFLTQVEKYYSEKSNPFQSIGNNKKTVDKMTVENNENRKQNSKKQGLFSCCFSMPKTESEDKEEDNITEEVEISTFEQMMEVHEDFNRKLAVSLQMAEKKEKEITFDRISEKDQERSAEDCYNDFQKLLEKHRKITSRFMIKTS